LANHRRLPILVAVQHTRLDCILAVGQFIQAAQLIPVMVWDIHCRRM
jgi:hypothetical protein